MVDFGLDGMGGRRGGQHISDEALVVSLYLVVHFPAIAGRPVPVKHILASLGVPVPFYSIKQHIDLVDDRFFLEVGGIQVLPDRKHPGCQERGFHQVAAVVFLAEGLHFSGGTVEPVGPYSMKPVGRFEKVDDLLQPGSPFAAGDKATLDTGEDGLQAKSGPPCCDGFGRGVSFPGHATGRVSKIPEIAEGLSLDQRQQFLIGDDREFGCFIGQGIECGRESAKGVAAFGFHSRLDLQVMTGEPVELHWLECVAFPVGRGCHIHLYGKGASFDRHPGCHLRLGHRMGKCQCDFGFTVGTQEPDLCHQRLAVQGL